MLEKPAYLLGDFIIEIGLAGSIGLYKIGCFGSVKGVNTHCWNTLNLRFFGLNYLHVFNY